MWKKLQSPVGGNAAAPSDPKDVFTAEVEQMLRSIPGVRSVTRVSGQFALAVVTSAGERTFYLDNAFAESREMSPEQRREKIAFFSSAIGASDQEDESWGPHARPSCP